MTWILEILGGDGLSAAAGAIMVFLGACAFVTALVVEALKAVPAIDALPTKLVCYIVALILTPAAYAAMMAFLKQPIEWFYVFAAFLAAFVVAKVAMSGWDDVTELAKKMVRK